MSTKPSIQWRPVRKHHRAVAYAPHSRLGRAERDLWYRMLVLRAVTLVLAIVSLGMAGEHFQVERRGLLLSLLVVVAGPYVLLHYLVLRKRGHTPWYLLLVDQLLVAIFTIPFPDVYAATAVTLIVSTVLVVSTHGRWLGVLGLATTAVPMAGIAIWADPPMASDTFNGWFGGTICTILILGAAHDRHVDLETRHVELVDGLQAVIWEADGLDATPHFFSEGIESWFGYPRADWYEPGFWESLLHPDDLWVAEHSRQRCLAGENHAIEYRVRSAGGRWIHVEEIVTVERHEDGSGTTRGVMIDVTDKRRAESRTRQYADIVERTRVPVYVLRLTAEKTAEIVSANPAGAAFAGVSGERLTGAALRLVAPWLDEALAGRFDELEGGHSQLEVTEANLVVHGESRLCRIRAFLLDGGLIGVSIEDLTERYRAAAALRRQALHDHLTGLPNRIHLVRRIEEAIERSKVTDSAVALLIVDITQFTDINDTLGHQHGDRLLAELGRRLAHLLEDAEMVARLGGDAFAVLLTEQATVAGALAVAERIDNALDEAIQIDSISLQVGASVGAAFYPDHATDADSLMRLADIALNAAKRRGAEVVVYAPEHDSSSLRRLTLLSELRRAVRQDELRVVFQPVLDLRRGEVVALEALVRWEHPELGLLLPTEFIELAEVSGLVRPLAQFVTEAATKEAATLQAAGYDLSVAINLSPRNLQDAQLSSWIHTMISAAGITPHLLRLEITESELMEDPLKAMEVLADLRLSGIDVSIDDFGTGYSSLSYLRDLPISEMKIDRSFVCDLAVGDEAITQSIIDMGHNLGLRVVAEGVENASTLTRLLELECDLAQGFFISRPLDPRSLHEFLAAPRESHSWHAALSGDRFQSQS